MIGGDMRRITQGLVLLLVLGLGVGLTSCGGDDDDDISGNYLGTLQDNLTGSTGSITASLTQNGSAVVGTFLTTFIGTQGAIGNGGNVSGAVSGSSVTLTVNPSDPRDCPFTATGSIDDDEITGVYSAFNCSVSAGGTFNIRLQ
jgi:hypothetical protein